MKLPTITDKQLEVLLYLYKFSYLDTNQFKNLFHHKNPRTVQEWLQDLKTKGYVNLYSFERNKVNMNMRPAVYSLTKLARQKLKSNPGCEIEELNRVYRKTPNQITRYRHTFLVEIYLHMQDQMGKNETFHFSTQANLHGFDYFPKPLPDAYIAIKSENRKKRYFLYLLDDRMSWRHLTPRIGQYLDYATYNDWHKYSKDPLPSFLLICPSEKTKRYLENIIRSNLPVTPFYLAVRKTIRESGFKGDMWEKVQLHNI